MLGNIVSLIDGSTHAFSIILASSRMFGKRHCPSARLSACAHVYIDADPLQLSPFQNCPALHRCHIRPVFKSLASLPETSKRLLGVVCEICSLQVWAKPVEQAKMIGRKSKEC